MGPAAKVRPEEHSSGIDHIIDRTDHWHRLSVKFHKLSRCFRSEINSNRPILCTFCEGSQVLALVPDRPNKTPATDVTQ